MKRRHFLAASAAALAAPAWAELGGVRWLSAAMKDGTDTHLVGLSGAGDPLFSLPIPSRGHAAAAHPHRAKAVAFARRPGRFAVVIDCASGRETARLTPPENRHFYGHGAFTADGALLFTTENDWETPAGVLGVWDAAGGYRRVGEVSAGGIGPHEMLRRPDGGFVVANGGIHTHPDYQRAGLNLPTMRPNLTYLSETGEIEAQARPPEALRLNSIRHIDIAPGGDVVIALQWQGDPRETVPLAARHRRGEALAYLDHPGTARLKHYAGSIAVSAAGAQIALTGPKGGHVLFFDGDLPAGGAALPEASGAARCGEGFALTMRGGMAFGGPGGLRQRAISTPWRWDNHLIAL